MELINAENYEIKIKESKSIVLIDFFAIWCGPCKMLTTELEKLNTDELGIDIYKVDVDENEKLAMMFNVVAVPTLLIYKNGNIVNRIEGYVTSKMLEKTIKEL